jgi:hypothetical protein
MQLRDEIELLRRPRIVPSGLEAPPALAVHASQPIQRDNLPSRRAGNDRVAGPGVDREVSHDLDARIAATSFGLNLPTNFSTNCAIMIYSGQLCVPVRSGPVQ